MGNPQLNLSFLSICYNYTLNVYLILTYVKVLIRYFMRELQKCFLFVSNWTSAVNLFSTKRLGN